MIKIQEMLRRGAEKDLRSFGGRVSAWGVSLVLVRGMRAVLVGLGGWLTILFTLVGRHDPDAWIVYPVMMVFCIFMISWSSWEIKKYNWYNRINK